MQARAIICLLDSSKFKVCALRDDQDGYYFHLHDPGTGHLFRECSTLFDLLTPGEDLMTKCRSQALHQMRQGNLGQDTPRGRVAIISHDWSRN